MPAHTPEQSSYFPCAFLPVTGLNPLAHVHSIGMQLALNIEHIIPVYFSGYNYRLMQLDNIVGQFFIMIVLLPQIQQNHFRRILLGLFHGKMLINIIPLDNRADHLTHIVIAFIPIELHVVKPHHVRYEIHPA